MKELYWIITIGNIKEVLVIIGLVLLLTSAIYYISSIANENTKTRKISKKYIIISLIILSLTSFIPCKEEMYLIYGLGSTIDYVKSNEVAKQLPDKAIKALNKWLELNEEEKK